MQPRDNACMGLPDPYDVAAYDAHMGEMTVGPPEPLASPIVVCDYDPGWPDLYQHEAARILGALGKRAIRIEHVGSTSVPGLPAKPIIDIVLEVPDSADEPAYAGDLESAGYALHIREPSWLEHRMFRPSGAAGVSGTGVHLHVFGAGCPEIDRMVLFRDHLRASAADRELYARVKHELATREWKYMQQYADAKSSVVAEIMARATA